MDREKIIEKIAGFYDDSKKAVGLLKQYGEICFCEMEIEEFASKCEEAYNRRARHGIKHSVEILKHDLEALAESEALERFNSGTRHVERKPSLQELDLIPNYNFNYATKVAARFGSWPRD